MTQELSESLEDYLEAIYHIVSAKQAARATDISKRMNVNPSSVTGALRSLAEKGLVNYAPYDIITLTAEGAEAGMRVAHRHEVLHDFFTKVLAVDDDLANKAACGMEHHVGREVLGRLGYLGRFIEVGSQSDGGRWLGRFLEFCQEQDRQTVSSRAVHQDDSRDAGAASASSEASTK